MSNQKLQPNRYQQAVNEVEKGDFKGVEVPKEINAVDRFHYKLLKITSRPDKESRKFINKSQILSVNENSYETVLKGLKTESDVTVIIVHDPVEQRKDEQAQAHEVSEKTAAENDLKIKEANEAKAAEAAKTQEAETKAAEAEAKAKEAEEKAEAAELKAKEAQEKAEAAEAKAAEAEAKAKEAEEKAKAAEKSAKEAAKESGKKDGK